MNNSALKKYAPQARKDFIAAVSQRANMLGLDPENPLAIEGQGSALIIGGRALPAHYEQLIVQLRNRIAEQGYAVVMEAMAYTWFNRLVAIRYMELHDFLDHGYRVLSHPQGHDQPEILDQVAQLQLQGLDKALAMELKLAGNRDEELYREILLAQCHALHTAMPFLFEPLDDATELLLPDGLLRTDSLIRQLVEQVDEALWQEIEIIGWLYQFYISEKKDQVIGKVVKSVDIPAATQLFTPNWIVKYMVQNSLGAQWLATYPQSPLKGQMEYYIEPAEQTDEVNAQLAAITPNTLNPEELTLIDPASGSGHILVEAYELFKAIYLERGYRLKDVPQLILEKNLFGLDIDERAAQLTGFALVMKGRADDRRLFERGVKLNVMALVDSASFDAEGLAQNEKVRVELVDYGLKPEDLTELKRLFEHATTFGSLIQVPEGLAEKLPALKQLGEATSQDLFASEALKRLGPLVQQGEMLTARYDAVVANPPYMGRKFFNAELLRFVAEHYSTAVADLFSAFMEQGKALSREGGRFSMITLHNWMFLKDFTEHRERFCSANDLVTLLHVGAGAFPEISGEVVQAAVFSARRSRTEKWVTSCDRRMTGDSEQKRIEQIAGVSGRCEINLRGAFEAIEGSPILYWFSKNARAVFKIGSPLAEIAKPRAGLSTGDNTIFQRSWYELAHGSIGFGYTSAAETADGAHRWFPCNSGGETLRWYGNHEVVVDWQADGRRLKAFKDENGKLRSRPQNTQLYFLSGVTWNKLGSSRFCGRYKEAGFVFDDTARSAFPGDERLSFAVLGALNSKVGHAVITALNPSMSFTNWDLGRMPVLDVPDSIEVTRALVQTTKCEWDAYERSWDFQSLPFLTASSDPTPTLESSYTAWITQNRDTIAEMKRLEEENNRLFIDAYGLADELTPDVPIEQITLTVNPAYRYGCKLTEEEQWTRFRQDTMEELVSYAIGCMMGRYSLDAPGLIYAHSGNEGFDPSRYETFAADDDGIVPITDEAWFDDDGANRIREFLIATWGKSNATQNMAYLAEGLGGKSGESPDDTIRRYLSGSFFKDHLQTYKKRPIYWLFSSGKYKAFEALVYLHRYNAGTLSRMRMEYVVPLQSSMQSRIESLDQDIQSSSSSAEQKRLQKQRDNLIKQLAELRAFDESLRHYADQRIELDLDDGVKVNYGRFGNLLAEVKAVTGGEA